MHLFAGKFIILQTKLQAHGSGGRKTLQKNRAEGWPEDGGATGFCVALEPDLASVARGYQCKHAETSVEGARI